MAINLKAKETLIQVGEIRVSTDSSSVPNFTTSSQRARLSRRLLSEAALAWA